MTGFSMKHAVPHEAGPKFVTMVHGRWESAWVRVKTFAPRFHCAVCERRIRVDEIAWKRCNPGAPDAKKKERVCMVCLALLLAKGRGT